jgi:hypothetical protein
MVAPRFPDSGVVLVRKKRSAQFAGSTRQRPRWQIAASLRAIGGDGWRTGQAGVHGGWGPQEGRSGSGALAAIASRWPAPGHEALQFRISTQSNTRTSLQSVSAEHEPCGTTVGVGTASEERGSGVIAVADVADEGVWRAAGDPG